jgi:hypothetical protein
LTIANDESVGEVSAAAAAPTTITSDNHQRRAIPLFPLLAALIQPRRPRRFRTDPPRCLLTRLD